jgi:hypothetical protein
MSLRELARRFAVLGTIFMIGMLIMGYMDGSITWPDWAGPR